MLEPIAFFGIPVNTVSPQILCSVVSQWVNRKQADCSSLFPDSLRCKCAARLACLSVLDCVLWFQIGRLGATVIYIHLDVTWWVTVKSEIGIGLGTDRKAYRPISLLQFFTNTFLETFQHFLKTVNKKTQFSNYIHKTSDS